MINHWKEGKLDLILIGAVSRDEMIYKDQVQKFWGGAVIYGAASASRSGANVGVISKATESDHLELQQLNWNNADLKIYPSTASTSIRNIYHTEDRERRTCLRLSAIDPFTETEIQGLDTKIVHVASLMQGEISLALLKKLASAAEVALDLQGFVRKAMDENLVLQPWLEAAVGLSTVSYLKADAAEAEIVTEIADIRKAARELGKMGPREVIVTHHKEVILAVGQNLYCVPFTNQNLDGRTGRGDTLFCSYLGRRALGESPMQALAFAAALTSIKLETPGSFNGTFQEIQNRIIPVQMIEKV